MWVPIGYEKRYFMHRREEPDDFDRKSEHAEGTGEGSDL